jgi:hypothetical protein
VRTAQKKVHLICSLIHNLLKLKTINFGIHIADPTGSTPTAIEPPVRLRVQLIALEGLMKEFKNYLLSRHVINDKKAGFYLYWVTRFYNYCGKHPGNEIAKGDIERYLKSLSKRREDWQVKQAAEAIQLYLFYKKRKHVDRTQEALDGGAQWRAVADDMHKMLRLKHLSLRTEQTCLGWVRRF